MPAKKRIKTKYPGVYYIRSKAVGSGKAERIYYIMYRKDGRLVEEKAGRQFQDDMTPARAAHLRAQRIEGQQLSNKARRAVKKTEKEAQAGRWTIDRLWQEYKRQRIDGKGLRTDKSRYGNYLKPIFGRKEPGEIIQLDVDRLRVRLLKKRSPQTVKHILNLLQWIINFGVKRQLCKGINFKIQKPRVDNLKTEDLTPEQLSNLLRAIDEDPNIQIANMMRLALLTGMRRGELFKLKWQDIDFERGFIHIRDPKGGKSQRIPLNDAARQVINSHPRTESEHVFPGRNGGQRTSVASQVNRIKKRAKLPKDFRPLHGLRHVYASTLASSGQVDLYTLQKLLTHKSPIMTQRYAHLRDETLKRASNLAGEMLGRTATENINGNTKKVENKKL